MLSVGMVSMQGIGGWKDQEFSFGHVLFQGAVGHPCRNVSQAVGDVGLDGGGEFWGGEVDLAFVDVEGTLKAMRFDVCQG